MGGTGDLSSLIASGVMNRVLSGFEAAAGRTHDFAPFVVVMAVQLDGGPTPADLGEALAAMQARQPLLRVRVAKSGGRYRFESTEAPIPLAVRSRAPGEDLWLEVVEEDLNHRIDDRTGPLMRCTYLPPESPAGAAEIVLGIHHSIVDAASGVEIVDQLLTHCATMEPRELPAASPPLMVDRLPRRFRGLRGLGRRAGFLLRQVAGETSYRLAGSSPAGPASRTTRCHPLVAGLDGEETSALVRATRRRRVTVKSVIDAAFLLAARRRLPGVSGSSRMRYMTFADLRPYLEPPLSPEVLGGFISLLRHTVAVTGDDDLWSLARRITRQVERAMRRGDKFTSALLADSMMRIALGQTRHRMATVAVSYTGPAGLREQYGSMKLRGMRGFISNFGLGPPYTASARLLANQLLLDLVYLDSDMDRALAESLAEEILATLRLAARMH